MIGLIFKVITLFFHSTKMIDDFVKRFPSKCPICSFHRYGIREGVKPFGSKPDPHVGCPERRGKT